MSVVAVHLYLVWMQTVHHTLASANPSKYMIVHFGMNVLLIVDAYSAMNNDYVFFFNLFGNVMMNQLELSIDTIYPMKLEANFANLSTWFTKTTWFTTNHPQVMVGLASCCSSSFAIVLTVLVGTVILTPVTLITRKLTFRVHVWFPSAIVFNIDTLAKLGFKVCTKNTS